MMNTQTDAHRTAYAYLAEVERNWGGPQFDTVVNVADVENSHEAWCEVADVHRGLHPSISSTEHLSCSHEATVDSAYEIAWSHCLRVVKSGGVEPCNDCGRLAWYDERVQRHRHFHPETPDCFLIREGAPYPLTH